MSNNLLNFVSKDIVELIDSFKEQHAVMRIILEGENIRDSFDIIYVCPNRYQLLFGVAWGSDPSCSPVFSRKTLKQYILERIRQGEEDDYRMPYKELDLCIGKYPEKRVERVWKLNESIGCSIDNIDCSREIDVEELMRRLENWLEIFEETYL